MIRSVIFDLDGTLLDTSEGVISSVKKTIHHFGLRELDDETLRTFIGPPISRSIIRIYGVSEEMGLTAMKYFRQEYIRTGEDGAAADIFKGEIYDGLEDLLLELNERGYRVGVATYKQESQAVELLRDKGLDKYFHVIHGADPDGRLSKADVVSMAIRDLGSKPAETVMIGDSDNDAIGAEGAGALFIGVTYGFGFKSEEDVRRFSNIGVADHPLGILDIIRED